MARFFVQATVVTANGSILTANDSENPDLFFGIRGGGCNFGVVTKFVLRLHPQKEKVFFGMLAFPADKLGDLITLANKWMETAGEHETLMLGLAKAPPGVWLFFVATNSFSIRISPSFKWRCFIMAPKKKGKAVSSPSSISVSSTMSFNFFR